MRAVHSNSNPILRRLVFGASRTEWRYSQPQTPIGVYLLITAHDFGKAQTSFVLLAINLSTLRGTTVPSFSMTSQAQNLPERQSKIVIKVARRICAYVQANLRRNKVNHQLDRRWKSWTRSFPKTKTKKYHGDRHNVTMCLRSGEA